MMLRKICFMLDGAVMSVFVGRVEEMARRGERDLRGVLEGVWEEVYGRGTGGRERECVGRVGVWFEEGGGGEGSGVGWERICVGYEVPPFLTAVITTESINHYGAVLRFLMFVKRARAALEGEGWRARKERQRNQSAPYAHLRNKSSPSPPPSPVVPGKREKPWQKKKRSVDSFRGDVGKKEDKKEEKKGGDKEKGDKRLEMVDRMRVGVRAKLGAFVRGLEGWCFGAVIEPDCWGFDEKVKCVRDVEELGRCHESFVRGVWERCLLGDNATKLMHHVRQGLSLAIEYANVCEGYEVKRRVAAFTSGSLSRGLGLGSGLGLHRVRSASVMQEPKVLRGGGGGGVVEAKVEEKKEEVGKRKHVRSGSTPVKSVGGRTTPPGAGKEKEKEKEKGKGGVEEARKGRKGGSVSPSSSEGSGKGGGEKEKEKGPPTAVKGVVALGRNGSVKKTTTTTAFGRSSTTPPRRVRSSSGGSGGSGSGGASPPVSFKGGKAGAAGAAGAGTLSRVGSSPSLAGKGKGLAVGRPTLFSDGDTAFVPAAAVPVIAATATAKKAGRGTPTPAALAPGSQGGEKEREKEREEREREKEREREVERELDMVVFLGFGEEVEEELTEVERLDEEFLGQLRDLNGRFESVRRVVVEAVGGVARMGVVHLETLAGVLGDS
ncbi:hypothetical protein HDV00_009533 [Rhizophlyctis rosea]|nr:hypothetical protein HDV00_009533 [Rhizophlyctis rosea]